MTSMGESSSSEEFAAATVFVSADRLLPIGRRCRRSETVIYEGRKYELANENGVEYRRLLSDDETLAGPWRLLSGDMA